MRHRLDIQTNVTETYIVTAGLNGSRITSSYKEWHDGCLDLDPGDEVAGLGGGKGGLDAKLRAPED